MPFWDAEGCCSIAAERAKWYIRRLTSMSLAEVVCRLCNRALVELEKLTVSQAKERFDVVPFHIYPIFLERSHPFFFEWRDRELHRQSLGILFPQETKLTLAEATEAIRHRAHLFSWSFQLSEDIDWQQDPRTGGDWPKSFYADIDIRDGQAIGGVRWVWELNRHHHLVMLGKAFFLSGEERYAQEVCTQMRSWIEHNPPGIGVNWTSSLELAIRLINWVWTLALIRRSTSLTPEVFAVISQCVVQQADHIFRHLSVYSSANNHLIGEAAGLAIVGLFFPWLPHGNRWRNRGLEILKHEIGEQVYPDGVPSEQAIHYLAFVLDFNLLVWRLAELNGSTVPQIWYDRLGSACDFISHVMDKKGNVPDIGDSDDAWVVRLDENPDANNYRSILAAASVLLKDPELRAFTLSWDEKNQWLLGNEGRVAYESLPVKEPDIDSKLFPEGGYAVMRTSGRVLLFDCGPLGYLSTAAHGHADALSLWLSVDGHPILVDSGTYAYQEGGRWRSYFRGTSAHNTIVVDGEDQSEIQGDFLWGRKAEAEILRWESNPQYDLAIAQHDGYSRLGIIHCRAVLYLKPKDCLVIVDKIEGTGHHAIEQLWHFPARTQINFGEGWTSASSEDVTVWFVPQQMSTARPETIHGADEPIQGWVSERYGYREAAPVLRYRAESDAPTTWINSIYLSELPDDMSAHKRQLQDLLTKLGVV